MRIAGTTLAAIERQPHFAFPHWEAQDCLPSFEFTVSPKIDYFQVFLPDTDLGSDADTLASLGLTGTRTRIKRLQKATAKSKGILVTVHDPSPAVIRRLDDALRSIGLWGLGILSELEVSLDLRPDDGDMRKLGELSQWARYFSSPDENVQKAYRYVVGLGRRKPLTMRLPADPLAQNVSDSLVPHLATLYSGHSKKRYVDRSRPHGGFLRSYIKCDEQTDGSRKPLPEDQWSARIEANVCKSQLEVLGLRRPVDLLGFDYRKKLSGYFRFALPEIKRRPIHPAAGSLAELVDRQRTKYAQHQLAIGVRATTGCRHIRQRRFVKANTRIGDALGNLERRFRSS